MQLFLVFLGLVIETFGLRKLYETNHILNFVLKINIIISFMIYLASKYNDYEHGNNISDRKLMFSVSTIFAITSINLTKLQFKEHLHYIFLMTNIIIIFKAVYFNQVLFSNLAAVILLISQKTIDI